MALFTLFSKTKFKLLVYKFFSILSCWTAVAKILQIKVTCIKIMRVDLALETLKYFLAILSDPCALNKFHPVQVMFFSPPLPPILYSQPWCYSLISCLSYELHKQIWVHHKVKSRQKAVISLCSSSLSFHQTIIVAQNNTAWSVKNADCGHLQTADRG